MDDRTITGKKKLPIGIQTFREIREGGYYYVDKTGYAVTLADEGKYYFLSRPRRFGKSLLVDTFRELFLGSRELFEGLYAENCWDWSISYPVLSFSFAGGGVGSMEALTRSLDRQLGRHEAAWGISQACSDAGSRFADLVFHVRHKTGQRVVILIDEYDKPILDAIQDRDVARKNRDMLRDFYSVIKDNDAHVRFAFLTGVSKFSKAGIFSGLNNLLDITLDARYSAICGYTEYDLDSVFSPELEEVDRKEMRLWYNGYNWLGESVYNPFDVLLFFSKRMFSAYWFETGTPAFLVNLLLEKGVFTPDLGQTMAMEMLLSTFDVDTMPMEALLFQTGYLTILKMENLSGNMFFTLTYPNREVYQSLNLCLVNGLTGGDSGLETRARFDLYRKLAAGDLGGLENHFRSLFASIPHDWHRRNNIADYEGYYASVFYSHFAALGLDIRVEDATSRGRVDMTVLFGGRALIFEFKVVEQEPDGSALAQLEAMKYAEKYMDRGEPVILIGVEFSRKEKNLAGFEIREL